MCLNVLVLIAVYWLVCKVYAMYQTIRKSFVQTIAHIGQGLQTIMNQHKTVKNQVIVSPDIADNYALILAAHLRANPDATMSNSALMRMGNNILRNCKNMDSAATIKWLEDVESVIAEVYKAAGLDNKKRDKVGDISNLIRESYVQTHELPAWVENVLAGDFDNYLTQGKKTKNGKKTNVESTIAPIGKAITGKPVESPIMSDSDSPLQKNQRYTIAGMRLKARSWSIARNAHILECDNQEDIESFKVDSLVTIDLISGYTFRVVYRNMDTGRVYLQPIVKTGKDNTVKPYGKPSESAESATKRVKAGKVNTPSTPTKAEVLARVMALLDTIE